MGKETPIFTADEARRRRNSAIAWSLAKGGAAGLVLAGIESSFDESQSRKVAREPKIIVDSKDYCPKLPEVTCQGYAFINESPPGVPQSGIIFKMQKNEGWNPAVNVEKMCQEVV